MVLQRPPGKFYMQQVDLSVMAGCSIPANMVPSDLMTRLWQRKQSNQASMQLEKRNININFCKINFDFKLRILIVQKWIGYIVLSWNKLKMNNFRPASEIKRNYLSICIDDQYKRKGTIQILRNQDFDLF